MIFSPARARRSRQQGANPVTVLGSTVSGVIHQKDHDDHGHIGLTDLDLEEVSSINVTKI